MFGAPTYNEIQNQSVFNPKTVAWLRPENATNLTQYDRIPVANFLAALKLLGVSTADWEKYTRTSSVLYAQLDNPMPNCDVLFQKVLDFLS